VLKLCGSGIPRGGGLAVQHSMAEIGLTSFVNWSNK
jgi:hypothetical protein